MKRFFDHVDLRVRDLRACTPFYTALLPALGFTERLEIEGWLQFQGAGIQATEFFGVTEDPQHIPNRSRISFWAESKARVEELASQLYSIGAKNIEGPSFESETYYAVFFEDPSGNALEICHRMKRNDGDRASP